MSGRVWQERQLEEPLVLQLLTNPDSRTRGSSRGYVIGEMPFGPIGQAIGDDRGFKSATLPPRAKGY
jgi:hypothetical protein